MCGNRYSGGYSLDGVEQLRHYLDNNKTHRGDLIIFDTRTRYKGKGLTDNYLYNNSTIRSYIFDVRLLTK